MILTTRPMRPRRGILKFKLNPRRSRRRRKQLLLDKGNHWGDYASPQKGI